MYQIPVVDLCVDVDDTITDQTDVADVADGGGAVTIVLGASIIGGLVWFDLILAFTALAILAAGWVVTAAGTGRLEVSSAVETTGRRSPGEPESRDGGGRSNEAPATPVGGRTARQSSAASAAS